ncbi:hypothetical protein [Moraxella boevrei]|uniref:hypothetical protein n=1 Tax=Faucicola boevrei TaxID=346665 RepID=UPI0037365AC4
MVAGSEIKITPEGVFITTPNIFKVKASKHELLEGEGVQFSLPKLPKVGNYNLHFKMEDDAGNPLAGKNYILYDETGDVVSMGVLDDEGKTPILHDRVEKEYFIHVLDVNFDFDMVEK